MTSRFGMGYGSMAGGPQSFGGGFGPMGYGPQTWGMGVTPACPSCGMQPTYPGMGMPQYMGNMMPNMMPWMGGGMPGMGYPGYGYGPGYMGGAQGYWPPYQTMAVPDDEQLREMIYDALDADPVIPYDSDINVDVTGGLVTLTGTVPNKRIKHAVGDDAWWIPGVWDVNNQLEVAGRARAERPMTRPTERPTEGTQTPARQRPRRPTGKA